jgi:hypothetical protein
VVCVPFIKYVQLTETYFDVLILHDNFTLIPVLREVLPTNKNERFDDDDDDDDGDNTLLPISTLHPLINSHINTTLI